MKKSNKIWVVLLKVSLGLILILSFLQVKMKFGWDPCSDLPSLFSSDINTPFQDSIDASTNKTTSTDMKGIKSSDISGLPIEDNTNFDISANEDRKPKDAEVVKTEDKPQDKPSNPKAMTEIISVTFIDLDKQEVSVGEGGSIRLKATVFPTNASNKILKWDSNNESIAQVNNGRIVGIKEGICTITVSSTDGSNKTAKCTVRVNPTIIVDKNLTAEDKVKRFLTSFKSKQFAKEIKSLFTSNAIVKIKDEGVIVNRRNALEYIDIVSGSTIIKKIQFVDMKINSNNKITELTVEEIYNN